MASWWIKMKSFKIKCDVWNSEVIVMIGGKRRQHRSILKKARVEDDLRNRWLSILDSSRKAGGALTMFSHETPWYAFVYFSSHDTTDGHTQIGTVAHEMFHAASAILHRKGVTLGRKSEEAYAYLIEHLTREYWRQVEE